MKIMIMTAAMAALVLAAPASAQQLFDFLGQAHVPAVVGGQLDFAGVIRDPAPAAGTPIPLDFANYEYTIVVDGLTLDSDGISQTYSSGTATIYEDAGTAADAGVAGTFTDGTAILTGDLSVLTRTVFPTGIGNATGFVDWVGGTRVDEMEPADRLNWAFLVAINVGLAEAGYDELWDGKLEPMQPIVAEELMTWGEVKALLR